jgi:hypothetical protein
MTSMHHHTSHWLRWGVENFLPKLASNYDPPNFHLQSSQDYRLKPPCLALKIFLISPCLRGQHIWEIQEQVENPKHESV